MQAIQGDQLRGHLDGLVLAALERSPAHGWDIARRLDQQARGALQLKEGTLYPALYRLESAGLVSARTEKPVAGQRGPGRRVYQLTAKGRRRLTAIRGEWNHFIAVVGGLLLSPS